MQYTEGQIGRVFVVRIDDGEDMLLSLRQFILDKNIQAGSIHFLGALMNGRMVTGPEEPVIPPVPHFVMFEGGWEVFGVGTIYPGRVARISIIMHRLAGQAMPSPAVSGKRPSPTSSLKRLSWSLPAFPHDGNSMRRCSSTFRCSARERRQTKRNRMMKKSLQKKRTRAQTLRTMRNPMNSRVVLRRSSGTSRAARPVEIPRYRSPRSRYPFPV